jgi:hypothetical protein
VILSYTFTQLCVHFCHVFTVATFLYLWLIDEELPCAD